MLHTCNGYFYTYDIWHYLMLGGSPLPAAAAWRHDAWNLDLTGFPFPVA